MMVRSELVQKIAEERPHLSPKDVEAAVEAIFKRIEDALASGKRVEIRGFGAFLSRQRKARMGRNPSRSLQNASLGSSPRIFFTAGSIGKIDAIFCSHGN